VPTAVRDGNRITNLDDWKHKEKVMLNLPILRWGRAYTSLEQDQVVHFLTGETLARVSQANTGLLGRDMRQAERAREVLTEIPIPELIGIMKRAADFYLTSKSTTNNNAPTRATPTAAALATSRAIRTTLAFPLRQSHYCSL
jgi:hypothetical protein